MPEAEEKALKKAVNREHPDWTQAHKDRMVYGHMVNEGWHPDGRKKVTHKHEWKKSE